MRKRLIQSVNDVTLGRKAWPWPGADVCVTDSHPSRFAGIIFKPHTALSRGCFPVLEKYGIVFQLSQLHVAVKKKKFKSVLHYFLILS